MIFLKSFFFTLVNFYDFYFNFNLLYKAYLNFTLRKATYTLVKLSHTYKTRKRFYK